MMTNSGVIFFCFPFSLFLFFCFSSLKRIYIRFIHDDGDIFCFSQAQGAADGRGRGGEAADT